ncbi:hypothetical protein ACIQYS_20055 [Psychrobacillus sp. NPDC096426]|uniref:hypothetical protein n=1 Tax=Psychrobacillus sp. NPDC096426 TaxID=3364491 RepID=UPI00381B1FD7
MLNNDKASIGKPLKDIHILNQIQDPYKFEEAQVEPINLSINCLLKIVKYDNIATIIAGKMKYEVDISKHNFTNPRKPYVSMETIEYSIENGAVIGTMSAYV